MKKYYLSVLLLLIGSASIAGNVPNGKLEVAYRQKQEGKLSNTIHNLELLCFDGQCQLQILTLNQCIGDSFYPKVETYYNLEVNDLGGNKLLVRATTPFASFTYSFTYTTTNFDNRVFMNEVSAFSGAVGKYSDVLDKSISWDLVPLTGWEKVNFDCPAMLKGVEPDYAAEAQRLLTKRMEAEKELQNKRDEAKLDH